MWVWKSQLKEMKEALELAKDGSSMRHHLIELKFFKQLKLVERKSYRDCAGHIRYRYFLTLKGQQFYSYFIEACNVLNCKK